MERIARLNEYLKKSPGDSFLKHALALEFIKIGNDQLASEQFENLLDRDPSYVGSYYHLAKLLERTGNTDEANKVYLKGMEVAEKLNEKHALGELRSAWEEMGY